MLRAGEHRERLPHPVRSELGDGDRPLRVAVRVVLEEHKRAAVLLGQERIGVEVARGRVYDREPVVRSATTERDDPLFLERAEHLLLQSIPVRLCQETHHLPVRRSPIDRARVRVRFVIGLELLQRAPSVAVQVRDRKSVV